MVAYWGPTLARAEAMPHPSEAMKPSETTEEQRFQLSLGLLPAIPWRLELGSATPLLIEIYDDLEANKERSEKETRKARDAIVSARRTELFTESVVLDHAMRLRDLALITRSRAPEDASMVLATALDLEARGSDSDYARAVTEKTLFLLFESMRKANEKEKAGV